MKIDIHVIQNFASSNLNRDDTGSPKDCQLGGVRRARISSQCLKRSMREAFEKHALVPPEHSAKRTKRIVEQVAAVVASKRSTSLEEATKAVATALGGVGITASADKEWRTQYLLFIPTRLIDELATVISDNFDALTKESAADPGDETAKKSAKARAKKAKADAKGAVPADVAAAVKKLLADARRTPELALFGRMIADAPDWNVDAACQVAHAVSTHRVAMEFDFYTAIDDLKPNDTAGSDMMGTVGFNSACFYRYLALDVGALERNLGGDQQARDQARATTAALLKAAVLAIPSGKQNSMAAQNPPTLVLADVREGGEPRSLTNAFVKPVRFSDRDGDIVTQSVDRLGNHLAAIDRVYGATGRKSLGFILADSPELSKAFAGKTQAMDCGSLDALIDATVSAAFGGNS